MLLKQPQAFLFSPEGFTAKLSSVYGGVCVCVCSCVYVGGLASAIRDNASELNGWGNAEERVQHTAKIIKEVPATKVAFSGWKY